MSEFDWWPQQKLEVLVRALRGCDNEPPSTSDESFWQKVADDCHEADGFKGEPLDAEELASDVHSEFDSARLTPSGITGLSIGDLCCAESRLVGLVKGIQGVVYVASHPMESLWAADGLQYHTIVVSIQEPSHTLSSQLRAACTFLAAHRPALICSSSPGLSACVVAAFNYHQGKGGAPILELLKAAQTELSIPPNDVSSSDMAELEAFANLVPPPTNSYVSPLARLHAPPPPPRTGPTQRQGAQGARRQSEEDDEDDEEIYAANEFSTPRMKPEVAPGAPFPFVGSISTDSTSTQVLDELVGTPNPSKRPLNDAADARITMGGKWKRGKAIEEGDAPLLPPPSMRATRSSAPPPPTQHKNDPLAGARDHLADEESAETKVAAMAMQKYVRGDCSRCAQVNILGWVSGSDSGSGSCRFECCACHDAFDDDSNDAGLDFSYDGDLIAV